MEPELCRYPLCSKCLEAEGGLISEVDIDGFCLEGESAFGKGAWLSALKLSLFEDGLNTYAKSTTQAKRTIDRGRLKKKISLADLAHKYGLSVTKTRVRKQLDSLEA